MYSPQKFKPVEIVETIETQDEARALINKLRNDFELGIEVNDKDLINALDDHTMFYLSRENPELSRLAYLFREDLVRRVKTTKRAEIRAVNGQLADVVNERGTMLPLIEGAIARLEMTGWDYDLFIEGPGGKFSINQVTRDAGINAGSEMKAPSQGPFGPRTAAQAESMARTFGEGIAKIFPGKVTFTLTHKIENFFDYDPMVLHGTIEV